MNQTKCVVCQSVKGKRICKIRGGALVCSRCCAQVRDADCAGCSHSAESEKYHAVKLKKQKSPVFLARVDPRVDKEVDIALEFVANGNLAQGEKLLTDLINRHPDLFYVQYGMGTVMAMKKMPEEAIVYFDNCLGIYPLFAEAWYNKGVAHKDLCDTGNTIKSMQKVVELGDGEEDFVEAARTLLKWMEESTYRLTGLSLGAYTDLMDTFERSFVKMQNMEYEEALSGFLKVSTLHKNHTQSFGNMGLCYAYLGRMQEALAALGKALEIDPEYQPALSNRAIILSLKDGENMPRNSKTVYHYREMLAAKEKMKGNTALLAQ